MFVCNPNVPNNLSSSLEKKQTSGDGTRNGNSRVKEEEKVEN